MVIRVKKTNVEKEDVGDNTLEIEVSKEWHDNRVLDGKNIAFTKRDDEGNVFSVPATCVELNPMLMLCIGIFTGEAGRLFILCSYSGAPRSGAHSFSDAYSNTNTYVRVGDAHPHPYTHGYADHHPTDNPYTYY